MRTYESKTGYVRNNVSGECIEASLIYMSCLDDDKTYSDITQAEYEAWEEEQRRKYEPVE